MDPDLEAIARSVNVAWYLINSFLIFFMKAGFIMLEVFFLSTLFFPSKVKGHQPMRGISSKERE